MPLGPLRRWRMLFKIQKLRFTRTITHRVNVFGTWLISSVSIGMAFALTALSPLTIYPDRAEYRLRLLNTSSDVHNHHEVERRKQ